MNKSLMTKGSLLPAEAPLPGRQKNIGFSKQGSLTYSNRAGYTSVGYRYKQGPEAIKTAPI